MRWPTKSASQSDGAARMRSGRPKSMENKPSKAKDHGRELASPPDRGSPRPSLVPSPSGPTPSARRTHCPPRHYCSDTTPKIRQPHTVTKPNQQNESPPVLLDEVPAPLRRPHGERLPPQGDLAVDRPLPPDLRRRGQDADHRGLPGLRLPRRHDGRLPDLRGVGLVAPRPSSEPDHKQDTVRAGRRPAVLDAVESAGDLRGRQELSEAGGQARRGGTAQGRDGRRGEQAGAALADGAAAVPADVAAGGLPQLPDPTPFRPEAELEGLDVRLQGRADRQDQLQQRIRRHERGGVRERDTLPASPRPGRDSGRSSR
ncbi:hypothetical protein THAOC_14147, partial [Thalassiosira oceanica]